MKISLDELKTLPGQKLNLGFNQKLDQLDAVKPVVGELSLFYSVTGLRLTGRVKTLLKLECDRCLRPYFLALNVDIDEQFVSAALMPDDDDAMVGEGKGAARELHGKDFVEPIPQDGLLDIDDVVYQAVTLATPAYRRCGSECPGPPQAASQAAIQDAKAASGSGVKRGEKPIDPRWKNLKTLFPNEDSQENS